MPDNQVWLDANLDIHSIPYVCFHELLEYYFMDKLHFKYDKAHKITDKMEMALRRKKVFDHF